ncbi:MAG TPA: Uma2 family endonuclease [Pyrinomonadaceae bacterium]|nr:Uma2 family endonuclease [Pyrinomonadaceae bacterium]
MKNIVAELPQVSPIPQMSYEDFLEWNGNQGWFEWVNGEVFEMSSPSVLHQEIVGFLFLIMSSFIEANKLGKVYVSPIQMKLKKHKTGRQPDLIFVGKENLGKLKKNYLDGAADLVIEIISPESRARDRGEKFYEYEAAGVKEYWLIDTERKQAEFYSLSKDGFFNFELAENGIFKSKVLQGLTLKVEWLWQPELPTLMEVLKDWKLI